MTLSLSYNLSSSFFFFFFFVCFSYLISFFSCSFLPFYLLFLFLFLLLRFCFLFFFSLFFVLFPYFLFFSRFSLFLPPRILSDIFIKIIFELFHSKYLIASSTLPPLLESNKVQSKHIARLKIYITGNY